MLRGKTLTPALSRSTGRGSGFLCALTGILIVALFALPLRAADPEGCLTCHQYRGLTRIGADGRTISLFYVNPNYWDKALGPHAHLKCTDCHLREQVEVFPHHPVSPVNCGRECHMTSAGKVELRFSHDRIDHLLGQSVHGKDALAESNHLLGDPLRAGQSQCLLCHDEPTFRRADQNIFQAQASLGRCDSCHNEQLPKDTRYAYWHVHARSEPARTNQDMARLCATCHSNVKVRTKFNLPDAAASYLLSFHGKAAQLGSQETAGCLDCHIAQTQNVHMMLSHKDAGSPTSPRLIGDTCRTSGCHRAAGQNISAAAIHLDLATSHGVEYFIACVFVALIVFTFGPSLMITALKMVHGVIGRHDPAEHAKVHRAQMLLALPAARRQLQRFNLHQRFQHWYLVLCFTTLVVTGFPIKFAGRDWAGWVIRELGGLPMARLMHRWAGALLLAGLFYHLIYVLLTLNKNRKSKGIIKAVLTLPMMVNPLDLLQMNHLMAYLLGLRRHHPEMGRFNAEEKFEYIGVFWGTIVLGTTGLLMWFNAETSRYVSGRLLTIAVLIHSFEAFLALLHVGVVHMVGVVFGPGVFPVSKAMFSGDTPAGELVEAHWLMLAQAEKDHGAAAANVAAATAADAHSAAAIDSAANTAGEAPHV